MNPEYCGSREQGRTNIRYGRESTGSSTQRCLEKPIGFCGDDCLECAHVALPTSASIRVRMTFGSAPRWRSSSTAVLLFGSSRPSSTCSTPMSRSPRATASRKIRM